MKHLVKTVMLTASLALSLTATAGDYKTDGQLLTECKNSINTQFEGVESIKVGNISSRRGTFKAKMKVKVNGERSKMLCVISDDQPLALTCANGTSCPASTIAAN